MTKTKMVKEKCHKCNGINLLKIYDSIDVAKNPELKDAVVQGSLFHYRCAECGNNIEIMYPFTYKDPEKSLIIHYFVMADDLVRSLDELVDYYEESKEGKAVVEDSTVRFVRDYGELLEKISIFDAGYDDRIIEIIKTLYAGEMASENVPFDYIEFITENGESSFNFYELNADDHYIIDLDEQEYKNVEAEYKGKLPNEFVVDHIWGMEFLGILDMDIDNLTEEDIRNLIEELGGLDEDIDISDLFDDLD